MSTAIPVKMQVEVERLRLKSPFKISGYTFTEVPVAVVTLDSDKARGRGEAAGVYYLNDTPDQIVDTLEAHRATIENGIDRQQLTQLLPLGGARNALDCALWDLEAKHVGKPVWELSGLDLVAPRITTFTLGADGPAAVVRAAEALPHAVALKLKLDGDVEMDKERVRAVRQLRPDVWIGVDANQGYTLQTLTAAMPTFVEAGVKLVEQPLPRGREAELEGFESPIPLAADESVQGLADVPGLVGRFQAMNIKLDKCGGLTEALAMVSEARRLGLHVMVGNMVGSSLAMAPAFVIAQLCDYVDLDGPVFLAEDRSPSITYHEGNVYCSSSIWGDAK
jgi:L-alanine-DL-glutamate epimerase-like enolase superfamily enzyme